MRILYRPYILRSIASFLLVESLTQVCFPVASYALTSGPTAPEATSFEPVDTTDMVDMASGDFTYTVPLIEVPGPEGGYPLSLAYHAGIKPNEDASWVGMGWSLNPGAINRNVNGFADDHESVYQGRRDYWEGGTRQTVGVGVSLGPKNMQAGFNAGVSFGLTFSQDTYRGFGIGANMSVGVTMVGEPEIYGASGNGALGVHATISTDGYGNTNAGIGVGASTQLASGVSGSISAGINSSEGFSQGVGLQIKELGASLRSSNSTPRLSLAGATATVSSAKAGLLQTETTAFAGSIPFAWGSVDISYSNTRYWSDQTADVSTNGSLYYPKAFKANEEYLSRSGHHQGYDFNSRAFDTYYLPDADHENLYDNPDPEWLQGGSFADYDNYVVTGQGIAGSMRPYSYQQSLYSQNKVANPAGPTYSIIDAPLPWTNKPMSFRFDNDFSNQYRQTSTGSLLAAQPYTAPGQTMERRTQYNFDAAPQRGGTNGEGYDSQTDRIAGSKAVEWYTNSDINAAMQPGAVRLPGFVDQQSRGFARDDNSQIGGFSVTNASGVTYHYALPVYSYDEQVYTEKIGSNGGTYTRLNKWNKYAYTWLLTAVTGPDYVDRDNNGLANVGDWGYWVNYSYGKWVDDYQWRNPSQGFHRDIDASFQSYSSGKKEIYYLNSINTRSHTALFVKSFRADAKGANPDKNQDYSISMRPVYAQYSNAVTDTYSFPAMQLKLDRILVLKNEDLASRDLYASLSAYNLSNFSSYSSGRYIASQGREFHGENILDVADISASPDLTALSQKSVAFSYNYTLCPKTVNSWSPDAENYFTNSTSAPTLTGKLTLAAVQSFGIAGASALPPTSFGYELSQSETRSSSVTVDQTPVNLRGTITVTGPNTLAVGDLLKLTGPGDTGTYYCTITGANGTSGASYAVTYLNQGPSAGTQAIATTTKNPPYAKDSYDMWGMFKGDFDIDLSELAGHDETMARATSEVSALNTDVWSLRQIRTPLGALIAIKYGSDAYRTKVIPRPNMVADFGDGGKTGATQATGDGPGHGHIAFGTKLKIPASKIFHVNQRIMISGIMVKSFVDSSIPWTTVNDIPVIITDVLDLGPNNETNVVSFRDDTGTLFRPHPDYAASNPPIGLSPYRAVIMGHVKLDEHPPVSYGGGIRTEEVSIITPDLKKTTRYAYTNNELPSGVTSYEPGSYLPMNKATYDIVKNTWPDAAAAANEYKNNYYNKLGGLLSLAREVPAPGVMYEFVTVQDIIKRNGEQVLASPQKTVYQLEVFKPNMIGVLGPKFTVTPGAYGELRTRDVAIHDFTSRIGRLKRRTTYDFTGVKLSETVNHYLDDEFTNASIEENASAASTGYAAKMGPFGYIGMIQEVFGDSRFTANSKGQFDEKTVMSHRNTYPVVLTSTTTTDFTTNISTTSENKAFDFLSGAVTKVLTTDGYGNRVLEETLPAYRIYPALGVKMGLNGGRNMLTQTASNTQYKVDAQGTKTGLLAASAQTWSNAVPVLGVTPTTPEAVGTQSVWRPQSSYSWWPSNTTSDGLTALTGPDAYVDFFTGKAAGQPLPSWKNTAEVTLYDVYSSSLEAKDINGKSMATKKGYEQSRVLMSGGPATYNELVYTGLEDARSSDGTPKRTDGYLSGGISLAWPTWNWNSGDVTLVSGPNRPAGSTHTGSSSVRFKPYKHGLSYEVPIGSVQPNKAYRVSVWASQPEGQVYYWVNGIERNVVGGTAQKRANGWYLIELTIPPIGPNNTSLRVGCYNSGAQDVYFDDFRFQPIDAQCTAYIYNGAGQVTHMLDNSNLYTSFEYDAAGRLIKQSRETFKYQPKLVSEVSYQYGPKRPALDEISLNVSAPSNSRTVQVTLNLPAALGSNRVIRYSPGTGVPFTTVNNATFAHTYGNAGTYWMRVSVTDEEGKQRVLVSKVIVL